MTPELYLNNPQGQTPLQKYIEMVNHKSSRSSNSENTISTVIISPGDRNSSSTRDRFSSAPSPSRELRRVSTSDKNDKQVPFPSTRESRRASSSGNDNPELPSSKLSKHGSANSRLESPIEVGPQYDTSSFSSSRKHSKDIVGELFTKDKAYFKTQKLILSGEIVLHEKMTVLYPMLHFDVVDVVIDYEKQVFGKESLDLDEIPILEKRCRRKLDELTARKAKIMYTAQSQDSISISNTINSKKSLSSKP